MRKQALERPAVEGSSPKSGDRHKFPQRPILCSRGFLCGNSGSEQSPTSPRSDPPGVSRQPPLPGSSAASGGRGRNCSTSDRAPQRRHGFDLGETRHRGGTPIRMGGVFITLTFWFSFASIAIYLPTSIVHCPEARDQGNGKTAVATTANRPARSHEIGGMPSRVKTSTGEFDPRTRPRSRHHIWVLGCDLRRHVLGLGIAKCPALIDLDALAVQIAHNPILILRACRACIYRKLHDGVDGHTSHPAGRAKRAAFNQGGYDSSAASGIKAIHTDYYA